MSAIAELLENNAAHAHAFDRAGPAVGPGQEGGCMQHS